LCNSCHKKIDFKKGERKIRFTHGKNIKLEKITSIEHVGLEPTYDIEMDTEEHNFLANKIVSHNSHAWTYSLISFQTAFCRTLFPLEFLTSLMIHNVHNTAGKDKVIEYIRTAQKLEYKVLAPDINLSDVNFTINEENQIVSGLTMINRVV
jgi:DNA polymerase-3 subunit alpha